MGINVRTDIPESDAAGFECTLLGEQDGHPGFVDGDVKHRHEVGEHERTVVTGVVVWVVPLDEWFASRPSLFEHLKDVDSAESRGHIVPLETPREEDARVDDVRLRVKRHQLRVCLKFDLQ